MEEMFPFILPPTLSLVWNLLCLVKKTWPYRTLQTIEEFKKGKVEFRADKTGIVHLPFGKANFSEEDLLINLMAAVVCYIIFHTSSYLLFVIYTFKKHYFLKFGRNQWNQTSQLGQKEYIGKAHIYAHRWGLQSG